MSFAASEPLMFVRQVKKEEKEKEDDADGAAGQKDVNADSVPGVVLRVMQLAHIQSAGKGVDAQCLLALVRLQRDCLCLGVVKSAFPELADKQAQVLGCKKVKVPVTVRESTSNTSAI